MAETLVTPEYYHDNTSAWSRKCRICGLRLREGEHDICSRPRCNDEPTPATPGFIPAATFGGDGPEPAL